MQKAKIFYGPPKTKKRDAANEVSEKMGGAQKIHLDQAYFDSCHLLKSFPDKLKAYKLVIVDNCPKDYLYHAHEEIIKKGLPIANKASVMTIYHPVQLIFLSNVRPTHIPEDKVDLFDITRFTKTWSMEESKYLYNNYAIKNIVQYNKSLT